MANVWKKQKTMFKLNGRTVPTDTPGAERVKISSRKWYGTVNGKHVPLCADKQSARTMLTKLQSDAALSSVGVCDPYARHRLRPLADHLEEYASHLRGKGDSEDHIKLTTSRVRGLFDGCGFKIIADVDAGRAVDWITARRQPKPLEVIVPLGIESFTPSEAGKLLGISLAGLREAVKRHGLTATGYGKSRRLPRATVEALVNRMNPGCGPATANHYVRAVRGFFRWMLKSKRIGTNPLDSLELVNAAVDVRRTRRELDADELRRLFIAARGSARAYRGLTGEDRYMLYLVAAGTGFRANALANLTPADFDLTAATVTLAARLNKSRRLKVQPLPADVADALRDYLTGKPDAAPVWGGTWARDHRGAEMLRIDLEAAGIPYAVEGPDGPEYADFHSLRHSYLTLGGRSGIDLRTLQELAGHSKPELTARYSHRRLYDLAGAVGRFPNLIVARTPESGVLRATGTASSCTPVARTAFNQGPSLSTVGHETGVNSQFPQTTEPPVSRGFSPRLACPDISSLQRGRRDSNPQPPDRQSGTLTN